jgi:hypothetical protein
MANVMMISQWGKLVVGPSRRNNQRFKTLGSSFRKRLALEV